MSSWLLLRFVSTKPRWELLFSFFFGFCLFRGILMAYVYFLILIGSLFEADYGGSCLERRGGGRLEAFF